MTVMEKLILKYRGKDNRANKYAWTRKNVEDFGRELLNRASESLPKETNALRAKREERA